MLEFTQNLMHSQMKLLTASQNNRMWLELWRNQTVAEKRRSTLSVVKGLKYKSRFWRETRNSALSSNFDLLLTPKPKWSQLKAFSVSVLALLTLSLRALSLYWFAVQQQSSTFWRQKYAWIYSKFNAQSDELTYSFPKTTGSGLKFEETKQ